MLDYHRIDPFHFQRNSSAFGTVVDCCMVQRNTLVVGNHMLDFGSIAVDLDRNHRIFGLNHSVQSFQMKGSNCFQLVKLIQLLMESILEVEHIIQCSTEITICSLITRSHF